MADDEWNLLDASVTIRQLIEFAARRDKSNGSYPESKWESESFIFDFLETKFSGLKQDECIGFYNELFHPEREQEEHQVEEGCKHDWLSTFKIEGEVKCIHCGAYGSWNKETDEVVVVADGN